MAAPARADQMMRHLRGWLALLTLLLGAACGSAAALTPTPIPGAVGSNAAWRPVIQTFNGVEMVRVPPGCFRMGAEDGRRNERPTAVVCFDRAFWIDRVEVTNAQYGSEGAYPGAQRPRENLTWFEARDFCQQRGARLPTEAEWEYAARGPDGLIYPWGNRLIQRMLQFDQVSSETAPVGSFPDGASWVGALDMSGNVWEWTSSLYQPYPYRGDDGRENPDADGPRVFRGGWLSYQDRGTGAIWRFRALPNQRDWRIGFRCARSE